MDSTTLPNTENMMAAVARLRLHPKAAEVRRREYREGRFDALPERALVTRAEGLLRKFAGQRVDGAFSGAAPR